METTALTATSTIQPIAALAGSDRPGTLAVITGVEGPSYRPVGAVMAVFGRRARVGSLSSGCVEADIELLAIAAREDGAPAQVRYGKGSPFKDIRLPCGGGLDILLVPSPDQAVLREVCDRHAARQPVTLAIDAGTGVLSLAQERETGWDAQVFHLHIEPEPFFYIFGKGPEAASFAALVQSVGFPNLVLSPDEETLAAAQAAGCATRHLVEARVPDGIAPDNRSAVVLFFHDHEWEPPILATMLESPAFYVGAQGSQRARAIREAELKAIGLSRESCDRIKGPIGLVRSVRDARTLAVSVLAEVLAELPLASSGQTGTERH